MFTGNSFDVSKYMTLPKKKKSTDLLNMLRKCLK